MQPSARTRPPVVRRGWPLEQLFLVEGLLGVVVGLLLHSCVLMAAVSGIAGTACVVVEWRRRRALDVLTLYVAVATLSYGWANLVGYLALDSRYSSIFGLYYVRDQLVAGQLLASASIFVPVIVFRLARRIPWSAFPSVTARFTPEQTARWCLALLAATWTFRFRNSSIASLGAISSLIEVGPAIVIFLYRIRRVEGSASRAARYVPSALLAIETAYLVAYASQRIEVVWPALAFVLPPILWKRATRRHLLVVLALAVGFVTVFNPLGQVRHTEQGIARLALLASGAPTSAPGPQGATASALRMVSRLSSFNQLSAVADVRATDGDLNGAGLAPLLAVPIPRLLWPSKPTISPGEAFARRLGRGVDVGQGNFSNAINMTIAGEGYLNFGWVGAVVALLLFSFVLPFVWQMSGALRDTTNTVGVAFSFLLICRAVFVGSSFAAVLQLVMIYLVMLVVGVVSRITFGR